MTLSSLLLSIYSKELVPPKGTSAQVPLSHGSHPLITTSCLKPRTSLLMKHRASFVPSFLTASSLSLSPCLLQSNLTQLIFGRVFTEEAEHQLSFEALLTSSSQWRAQGLC